MATLPVSDLAQRWAQLEEGEEDTSPDLAADVQAAVRERNLEVEGYRYYRPLTKAVDEYVAWAQAPQDRIYLGIEEFDGAMRGIAPGEMTMIIGYAHQGKTVLATEAVLNNREKHIVVFSPDETQQLLLVKLACLIHNVSAETLERDIGRGDPSAADLLRRVATESFPRLAVFEEPMGFNQMDQAVKEVTHHWQHNPELVLVDYLELLPEGDSVPTKANALKGWGKRHQVPMLVLHQTSRSGGAGGQTLSLSSGGYGGEQQAIHLLGVRRKREYYRARIALLTERIESGFAKDTYWYEKLREEAEHEMIRHWNTITLSLIKNKRPPGKLVDDLDFHLDQNTGRIKPIGHDDSRAMQALRMLNGD